MPLSERAAQFAPFAALTGYEEMIERTGVEEEIPGQAGYDEGEDMEEIPGQAGYDEAGGYGEGIEDYGEGDQFDGKWDGFDGEWD